MNQRPLYRQFYIEENWPSQWEWTHEDYDGPEDSRHGHDTTEAEAKASVDAWHEENA